MAPNGDVIGVMYGVESDVLQQGMNRCQMTAHTSLTHKQSYPKGCKGNQKGLCHNHTECWFKS